MLERHRGTLFDQGQSQHRTVYNHLRRRWLVLQSRIRQLSCLRAVFLSTMDYQRIASSPAEASHVHNFL